MDEHSIEKIIAATHWPRVMAATALAMLALFLLVLTVSTLKGINYVGTGITPSETIQVTGEGKVLAVPDTATFSVTVQNSASDVQTVQTKTTDQANSVINYLVQQGVASSSIQTTDYEIDPQYSYSQAACPNVPVPADDGASPAIAVYCPPGRQVLTGYQVSETLSVQVMDTSKAGTLLSGVGSLGAQNVSGLSFTVSDQDALQEQAQQKAITEAQTKAQALAKSLGVRLVGVVGFSENNGGGPVYPMAFATNASAGGAISAPAPEIATGQNTITDDVTVMYEIQ